MPRKRPVARELGENRVPELPETDVARSPRGRPRRAVTQEQGNHSAPYVLIAFPKSIETVCRNTFISQIHWHCLTIVQSNYSYTRSEILTLCFTHLRRPYRPSAARGQSRDYRRVHEQLSIVVKPGERVSRVQHARRGESLIPHWGQVRHARADG